MSLTKDWSYSETPQINTLYKYLILLNFTSDYSFVISVYPALPENDTLKPSPIVYGELFL
jgi:hypothetical protein